MLRAAALALHVRCDWTQAGRPHTCQLFSTFRGLEFVEPPLGAIHRALSYITVLYVCYYWAWSCQHHTDPDVFTYNDAINTLRQMWVFGHPDVVQYDATSCLSSAASAATPVRRRTRCKPPQPSTCKAENSGGKARPIRDWVFVHPVDVPPPSTATSLLLRYNGRPILGATADSITYNAAMLVITGHYW